MPGVLVIEALAQAGGLLTQLSASSSRRRAGDRKALLPGEDRQREVLAAWSCPGDRLELDVTLKRIIRNMAMYTGIARVDGEQVASADILCAEAKA